MVQRCQYRSIMINSLSQLESLAYLWLYSYRGSKLVVICLADEVNHETVKRTETVDEHRNVGFDCTLRDFVVGTRP